MKLLSFILICSIFSASQALLASGNAPCDLTYKSKTFRIVSNQTNNYAASNYTEAVEELRDQCPSKEMSTPVWHATSSLNIPPVGYHEYGVWEAYCSDTLTIESVKSSTCKKIQECIITAQPNESIEWLIRRSDAVGCNKESHSSGRQDLPNADRTKNKGCLSYIGAIRCYSMGSTPHCSFRYTEQDKFGVSKDEEFSADVGMYPYGFIVTIPFAAIAVPIMTSMSEDKATSFRNSLLPQTCPNARVE